MNVQQEQAKVLSAFDGPSILLRLPDTFPLARCLLFLKKRHESFEEILKRTIEHNPNRSETSLRRGVLHNAHEIEDGKWSWRYDIGRAWKNEDNENASKTIDFSELWNKVAGIKSPVHLWLGGAWSVVGDEDVEKMKSFQQEMVVKKVKGAGHSIQGDKPLELKELIRDLLRSKIVN